MKRWKTLTAALLAAAALLPTAQAAHTHPEVPPLEDTNLYSSWAKEGVQRALAEGISMDISGDYTVPATRNEFRKAAMTYVATNQEQDFLGSLVARYLAEKDEQGNMKLVFQDKLEDVEYNRQTDRGNSLAYYLGVVDGRSPGHFDPDAPITRQEAAVMLAKAYRVVGKMLPEVSEDLPFQDVEQIADWAKESVAVMYHWGILQGKEDGSFDPQGSFTREQCLLTLLRLCDSAPVSRKNGNVERMFTYDQVMGVLGEENELARWEGPTATLIRHISLGPLIRPTTTFFVYRDGRCRFFDLGICNIHGVILSGSVDVKDGAFSEDGRIFTCTAVLTGDSTAGNGSGIGVVVHRAGLYHITVDVETLEVTQTWEPLPA
ncbi:MAG: S-layer homology domain-containing protein [Ruminiclostridium sp.]|jgi:hypothetical protein|nr:S-layer homology domain-containing protein [Ruminiclostridium sp.]MCI9467144.1 S-layer homology domain-containing protein [Ruminiclostridium sp.]